MHQTEIQVRAGQRVRADGKVPENLKEGWWWLLYKMFEIFHQWKEGPECGGDNTRRDKIEEIDIRMTIGYLTIRKRYKT